MTPMLEIKNLHAGVDEQGNPEGAVTCTVNKARCTRSWGRTAPGKVRWPNVLAGRPDYDVTAAKCSSRGRICWR